MHSNRNADNKRKDNSQFFTPAWVAEIVYDAHLSHLTSQDLLWEPTCGIGNMLAAVPAHVPAFGTELDADLAEHARIATGRNVITADALKVDLPTGITALFGNPPWEYDFFSALMQRAASILDLGNRAVFIIPAYFFQTSRTLVALYKNKWTISQEIAPRDIFPGLIKPMVIATFIRDNNPQLIGFRLFHEAAEMRELPEEVQDMMANKVAGPRSTWREIVKTVLTELGGVGTLRDIYKRMEGRRPTDTAYWKEQIRKQLQLYFTPVSEGTWSLNSN